MCDSNLSNPSTAKEYRELQSLSIFHIGGKCLGVRPSGQAWLVQFQAASYIISTSKLNQYCSTYQSVTLF